MKVYKCDLCKSVVEKLNEGGCAPSCCGQPMREMAAGSTDGAVEKHVPVVEIEGNKVKVSVGSAAHPMLEEHYIEWIALETDKSVYRRNLKPGQEPAAEFTLTEGESVKTVYEMCNLHGLWAK